MRNPTRRRKLSMTSLIDVIFLLLLFFMLSSTFTRFAEVELASAAAGGAPSSERPVFLSLASDALRVNGAEAGLDGLADTLAPHRSDDALLTVLVASAEGVSAQRLTDLLVALRAVPRVSVTVLEGT